LYKKNYDEIAEYLHKIFEAEFVGEQREAAYIIQELLGRKGVGVQIQLCYHKQGSYFSNNCL